MEKLVPVTKGKTTMEIAAIQAEIDIAYKLAESIRKFPRKWDADRYRFTGPGPVIFWIANGESFFEQHRPDENNQPVRLGAEVCRKIIWPAYVEWLLQINSAYLNTEPRFSGIRRWWRRRKVKPVALLEYHPEKQIN